MSDNDNTELIETSAAERFLAAQEEFNAQLAADFPDFTVEEYAAEKAAAEGIDQSTAADKLWATAKTIPASLDVNGDGKLDFDDVRAAAQQTSEQITKAWNQARSISKEDVTEATTAAGKKISETWKGVRDYDYRGAAKERAQKAKEAREAKKSADGNTSKPSRWTLTKIGKTAVGVQGFQDRKEAQTIKQVAETYVEAAEAVTQERREALYADIQAFGQLRLEALHETLGRFLRILEALKQNNRAKEYELLDDVGIDTAVLDSMGELDMTLTQNLTNTAVTGTLAAAAAFGTPALVQASVAALATASTGTAISSLSGAAASNAVLAWLGGGSIAMGGGGMAAGTAVLASITVGATAGVTILAAGVLVSTHYAKRLTDAKTYQRDAALGVAGLERAWLSMDGITARVDELSSVTLDLKERLDPLLTELEAMAPTFDFTNREQVKVFNQCGLLVKTMVELAQVPLLGDDGELTDESMTITVSVKRILNTEV